MELVAGRQLPHQQAVASMQFIHNALGGTGDPRTEIVVNPIGPSPLHMNR